MGNMLEKGDGREFVYDAFGHLVKVNFDNGSTTELVARFRYNGLGHLIARTYDNNSSLDDGVPDGSVDADDLTYVHQYDGSWRMVATYRATTTLTSDAFVSDLIERARPPLARQRYSAPGP